MKKIYLFIVTLLVVFSSSLQAQVVDDDTEITVTNEKGENETFDLPEAMTSEIDSLLHLYNTKTYLKRDADCNFPNVNKTYEPDVYKDRLRRLPTIMEMPYNNVVQKFIDRYSNELRNAVGIMLGASNFYMPIFEQALETYSLPLELKYLPVIESGLNPKAVSRVGATGLWQFMLTTAKNYGLEINSLLDERCDPIKSSYAAANYLSDLYRIFGDWNLVIAAYNCGPDKLTQAIHRAGGSKDYWKIYPYLPRETRGYVPAFIAANYIMNYYCEHNICPMTTDLPAKTDTILVSRDVHFKQIAQVLNVDEELVRSLNPQYRKDIVIGYTKPSTLRLPVDKINSFIDQEDSVYAYNADVLLTKRSEVEVAQEVPSYSSGRTSAYSSRKSYSRSKSKRSRRKSSRSSRRRRSSSKSVTVRGGDTLSEIAARNHTTVKKLKRLNGLKSNNIRKGKKIRVR
ncbi:transglycosylase SLT domain-containing protein [Hoylesella buccalis]|uniref:lytic transglycosylase domain-containing protein n=1 Tax=Hoylesella buccalis TaxID=28127 RepID=UPI001D15CA7F|nr:lytic transglycosylase domain-containing protein [Hoylesella buccalis]UEA63378.1 transglycosylase SLT domain-containing protein [Hoylesella buccalis]UWP49331.1 transglycosylase SLT domain-containing protein [Hoylesella buccalis ATCC 35310]